MISFAQFRPEKNHALQLHIWQSALKSGQMPEDSKFWLVGSTRNADDEQIVKELKALAE